MEYEDLFETDSDGEVMAIERVYNEETAHKAFGAIFNKFVTDNARGSTRAMVTALERVRFELCFLAHNTFYPMSVYNECMESVNDLMDEVRTGGCCVASK